MSKSLTLRQQLFLGTAIAGTFLGGYGRRAYAGSCTPVSGPAIVCSGAAGADVTQTLTITGTGTATTTSGFGMNTAAGDAIRVTGAGTLTDSFGSNIIGNNNGIWAGSNGQAGMTISTNGQVTGTNNIGIINRAGSGTATVTANNVTGNNRGIDATVYGAANVVITASGTVIATGTSTAVFSTGYFPSAQKAAIYAYSQTGNIAITANNVSGGVYGIRALENSGVGKTVQITTNGAVVGTNKAGIFTSLSGGGAGTTIVTNGTVTGKGVGIGSINLGGVLSITSSQAVEATGGAGSYTFDGAFVGGVFVTKTLVGSAGIYGFNQGTDLSIISTAVKGGTTGIKAINNGTGSSTISASNTVEGISGNGIDAANGATATSLTINTATVNGGTNGISAVNSGTGATTITALGPVTGTAGNGITAQNGTNSTNLTINAAAVTGGQTGIYASNLGAGLTSVTASGAVTGISAYGINARNGVGGTDLTVNAAAVTAATYGIIANGQGTGTLSVTATGAVSATSNTGIRAVAGTTGTGLTISANSVSGRFNGIFAENYGAGINSVTATGDVNAVVSHGVQAINRNSTATDLIIHAATVTAGSDGISANNNGTGDTSVTATGPVTSSGGNGILAFNLSNARDLTIDAVTITGQQNGIAANNFGTGATTVNTTGLVTGTTASGINAQNGVTSTNLTINAAAVTGAVYGILAAGQGTGALSVTATGAVSGTLGTGIHTFSGTSGTGLTINANSVSGTTGIFADNYGAGNNSITATGDVNATLSHGIQAYNRNSTATDLIINAATVTARLDGIKASNNGTGDTSVTATGPVTSSGGFGVSVLNLVNARDLTVTSADVTGNTNGIDVRNSGTGSTMINTLAGTVTGTIGNGIYAVGDPTGDSMTITTSDVTGGDTGIRAVNRGSGGLTVTASGTVTGTSNAGIYARNGGVSADMTISAENVFSGGIGIQATNYGTGTMTVSTTGQVTGSATIGVFGTSGPTADNMLLDVADTTGGLAGVLAFNYGLGTTTINADGAVTGSLAGIYSRNQTSNGSDATIHITSNGLAAGSIAGIASFSDNGQMLNVINDGVVQNSTGATTDVAIKADRTVDPNFATPVASNGAAQVTNNGLVLGTVLLSGLADSFTNSSGAVWNTAGGNNEFGAGNDVVNNSGTVIAALNSGVSETTRFSSLERFNLLSGGSLLMNDGAVGDKTIISGVASGTSALTAAASLTGGDFFGSGGAIYLDTFLGTEASASDLLVIEGNSSGNALLFVSNTTGSGALTAGYGIQVITVGGASNAAFTLGAPVIAGAFSYSLMQADGQNWYLRSVIDPPVEPPVEPPVLPPVVNPRYQPGAPVYESLAQSLLGSGAGGGGLSGITTLQERLGNKYWSGAGGAILEQGDGTGLASGHGLNDAGSALWTRFEASTGRLAPAFSTTSASADTSLWQLRAGFDGTLFDNDNGTLIAGASMHYGTLSTDISSRFGNGNISTTGIGLGGALTWFGQNGFYIDAQGTASWYESDLGSNTLGALVSGNNGSGYGLSIEGGKRIQLGGGWSATPQAQLTYSNVHFDTFTGPHGEVVSLPGADSLNGRLGVSLDYEKAWTASNGSLSRSHVYGIGNLYYDFSNAAVTNISGTNLYQQQDRLWGGLGLGGSYNWDNDRYALFGEASVTTSLANFSDSLAVKGDIGLKINW